MNITSKKSKLFEIRFLKNEDQRWLNELITKEWASERIVTRGRIHYIDQLNGIIACEKTEKVGVLTYDIVDNECEIISMNSLKKNRGVGSLLLKEIEIIAISKGCNRLWLITTNDNTDALRFYQKKGFKIVTIYANAIEKSRILKPEIPLLGNNGIEIRDEVELEKKFD